jgi:hypothetical protein
MDCIPLSATDIPTFWELFFIGFVAILNLAAFFCYFIAAVPS